MSQWRSAAVALAQVRAQEIASADLARIANDLDDVSIQAARARSLATSSGLVAQQRIFGRAARP
jgi:hypothetical protein